MLRLSLLLVVLTQPSWTVYVTNTPSFAARLARHYEKLERITVSPPKETTTDRTELWNIKLQKLNSLSPENFYINDEDEDLLVAMQSWSRLSPGQLDEVAKELQKIRDDGEDRSERMQDQEYGDIYDNDEEYTDMEYHNDGKEDEDDEDPETSTPRPVTPSAFTRDDTIRKTVVSAADPIAATNARPTILSDETLTPLDRSALRQAALTNMGRVVRAGKCLVPQPRWLTVRQLAPAADTVYMPPCVELHRCAPDSGCCNSESEVCAPIDGKYVAIPFLLHKADGNMSAARILFFNHTQCACVSRVTLQTVIRSRRPEPRPESSRLEHRPEPRPHIEEERQNDWHPPSEPLKVEKEEDVTAPPQMRRCTCPGQFLAVMPENGPCTCECNWPDPGRRRDCLPLSRGDEHFGLRDRVCVASGDCTPPSCKYGVYDRNLGKCPPRKIRRIRYHHPRRYQPEKTVVV